VAHLLPKDLSQLLHCSLFFLQVVMASSSVRKGVGLRVRGDVARLGVLRVRREVCSSGGSQHRERSLYTLGAPRASRVGVDECDTAGCRLGRVALCCDCSSYVEYSVPPPNRAPAAAYGACITFQAFLTFHDVSIVGVAVLGPHGDGSAVPQQSTDGSTRDCLLRASVQHSCWEPFGILLHPVLDNLLLTATFACASKPYDATTASHRLHEEALGCHTSRA
jgi:hypothetical protein